MHKGSALSPLLFVIVMEALSREFRVSHTIAACFAVVPRLSSNPSGRGIGNNSIQCTNCQK